MEINIGDFLLLEKEGLYLPVVVEELGEESIKRVRHIVTKEEVKPPFTIFGNYQIVVSTQ